jgi:hypothetical protein
MTGCSRPFPNCHRSARNIPTPRCFGSSNTVSAEPACLPTAGGIQTKKYGLWPAYIKRMQSLPQHVQEELAKPKSATPGQSPARNFPSTKQKGRVPKCLARPPFSPSCALRWNLSFVFLTCGTSLARLSNRPWLVFPRFLPRPSRRRPASSRGSLCSGSSTYLRPIPCTRTYPRPFARRSDSTSSS